jgi:preprotein translocase subunit SecE
VPEYDETALTADEQSSVATADNDESVEAASDETIDEAAEAVAPDVDENYDPVAELRKVIWPTRKELLTYTAVVVVFLSIITAIVVGLDFGLAKGVLWVFG